MIACSLIAPAVLATESFTITRDSRGLAGYEVRSSAGVDWELHELRMESITIKSVEEGGPAFVAGLRERHIGWSIVGVDGACGDIEEVSAALQRSKKPDYTFTITLQPASGGDSTGLSCGGDSIEVLRRFIRICPDVPTGSRRVFAHLPRTAAEVSRARAALRQQALQPQTASTTANTQDSPRAAQYVCEPEVPECMSRDDLLERVDTVRHGFDQQNHDV